MFSTKFWVAAALGATLPLATAASVSAQRMGMMMMQRNPMFTRVPSTFPMGTFVRPTTIVPPTMGNTPGTQTNMLLRRLEWERLWLMRMNSMYGYGGMGGY